MTRAAKEKAYELRKKGKADLISKLGELRAELATVRTLHQPCVATRCSSGGVARPVGPLRRPRALR